MFNNLFFLGQSTTPLEISAMIAGILGVWLTVKQNVWCFPVGIINVLLYAILFYDPSVRLYADALLQLVYTLLLIYGWIKWIQKKDEDEFIPSKIILKKLFIVFFITIIFIIPLSTILKTYTSASLPWIDSTLTCFSLAAQWMIAKKYIENWIIWIFADILYIPMYIYKHLPLTAFLYFIFLVLAVKGYYDWKKNLIGNEKNI